MRYGLWIISCATNEQILQIEKDNEFPLRIPEMTREIEAAYRADPFFQNLKDRWRARLNRYSLTGVVQLGRWEGDASSGLRHDDEDIRDVVTIATLCILVLAAKFLAVQKYPADSEQIEALARGYASSTSSHGGDGCADWQPEKFLIVPRPFRRRCSLSKFVD
jgi:hypothetical protein